VVARQHTCHIAWHSSRFDAQEEHTMPVVLWLLGVSLSIIINLLLLRVI
jgi:hypothetical protein